MAAATAAAAGTAGTVTEATTATVTVADTEEVARPHGGRLLLITEEAVPDETTDQDQDPIRLVSIQQVSLHCEVLGCVQ